MASAFVVLAIYLFASFIGLFSLELAYASGALVVGGGAVYLLGVALNAAQTLADLKRD